MKPPSLTIGIEEEYQIIDPETRELQVVHHADPRGRPRSCSGEVKPELHQSMVEVGTEVCQTPPEVRAELVRLRARRHGAGRRRTASRSPPPARTRSRSWATQEITPLERYLGVQGGHAGPRAAAADLRHARPHRHRGPRVPHRRDERRALLAAARPVPLDQLAVLDRPQHRAEVVPQRHLPQLPAHRHPARSSRSWADYQSWSTRWSRPNCIPDGSKIWWDVRPHWKLPDARVPHLRRLHARGRGGVHRGDLPGDHREAVEAAARQHDVPRLPAPS